MDFIGYEMLNPNQIEKEDLQEIFEIFQQAFGRSSRNEVGWYLSKGYGLIGSRDRSTGRLIAVLLYKNFQRLKSVNIGYIAVEEKYRGRGIGSKLLRVLIEELMEKGELEYAFTDTLDAIRFYLKNHFLIVRGLVLTFPDEPPSYLVVYSRRKVDHVSSNFLKLLIKEWVEETYDEEELEIFKEYFDLILWNIDLLKEKTKQIVPLCDETFLNYLIKREVCRNIPLEHLRNIVLEVVCRLYTS